jgi:uracil-DNA glycosylase
MPLPLQWNAFIIEQQKQPYFRDIQKQLAEQRAQGIEIYPCAQDVFNAFSLTDLSEVKVVILGQDPYHGPKQANGFAFSINPSEKVPPSLKNIYKELAQSIDGFKIPQHGDLSYWAQQGVLLLNTVLTVQRGKAHSHAKLGWETFTDAVIAAIDQDNAHCVFMLWGAHAQAKGERINRHKHLVLEAPHPSPLSAYRGFFGCNHFVSANNWLAANNISTVNWQIKENTTLDLF